MAKIVGHNVRKAQGFDEEVRIWVFEEMIDGTRLTDIINTQHINVKYLPNIKLPTNVVAYSDLKEAIAGATLLLFIIPHQFVKGICAQLKGHLASNAKAISMIKGVDASSEGLTLISDIIKQELQIDVSVLMGANIASGVALDEFCESTIGYCNLDNASLWKKVFNTPTFRISMVNDVAGTELCGALKNVVAIGAGFVDGLKCGDNTKAAIIRLGLVDMKKFAKYFYKGVRDETFLESCGIGDLLTTCYGGRNRRVAEAHVLTGKSFEELERELLGGQKLQGIGTAKEIHQILAAKGLESEFPLFTAIYRICYEGIKPSALFDQFN